MSLKHPGAQMRAEAAEIGDRFAASLLRRLPAPADALRLGTQRALYTLARGSSDAAAMVLSYEIMRLFGIPATTLPPSVFSLQGGLNTKSALALAISQSGRSPDLVRAASGFRAGGGKVVALLNTPESPVGHASDAVIDVLAGQEKATPATKSVVCSIAAGLALIASERPAYADHFAAVAALVHRAAAAPVDRALVEALAASRSLYVIGRGSGFGAAQEVALKMKECCAIHAEAYSASEVLHGPLQLASPALTVLILDTAEAVTQESLAAVEARFAATGAAVHRLRLPSDMEISPAAAAAVLLAQVYPVILETALALGLDPDAPAALSKITETI